MAVVVIGLTEADDVIAVGQVGAHVDLVDHQGHVKRITSVRINILGLPNCIISSQFAVVMNYLGSVKNDMYLERDGCPDLL